MSTVRPGQVWEETRPADGRNPERIVIYGTSNKNGLAFFVSADPAKPAEKQSCRLLAFWPDRGLHESGTYRLIADAPDDPLVRTTSLISVDYAREWATHLLTSQSRDGSEHRARHAVPPPRPLPTDTEESRP